MKKYLIILFAILSSCGVRKVQNNKTFTEVKETSVQTLKTDSTSIKVNKTDIEEKKVENNVDTSKISEENKTVVEFFSEDGKLIKRITSNKKKSKQNYISVIKEKKSKSSTIDSLFLTMHSELKDSSVLDIKKVEKIKETTSYKPNFAIFGLMLILLGLYLYWKLK